MGRGRFRNASTRSALKLNGSCNMPQSVSWRVMPSLCGAPSLRATKSVEITFVTTNYDRSIELAANGEKI